MKILCLYNPQAGGGKARKELEYVRKLFQKYQIEADIRVTQYPHHATQILQETVIAGYQAIVAAGGDGTFFDVLNGYLKNHSQTHIPLGLIPVGTGNSLSRDIALDNNDLEDFIKIIHQLKTKAFDVAKVDTEAGHFYFANMMGFGFTTDVTLTAIKLKWLKNFAYTLGVLFNTIKLKTYPLQITVNGQTQIVDNTFITVSNSQYTGNDFHIAPKAKVDDGLLDIIIVNKVSRLNLLKTFPKIFDGSYIHSPYVTYIQTDQIKFSSPHIKFTAPDGEVLGQLPIEISVIPKAISLLVQ